MSPSELNDFATRYAAAWSGQDPARLASFYSEEVSLTLNSGAPSVGRAAIAVVGFEQWTPDAGGLIAESKGHFDEAESQRQVSR